jgi:hypothetical protein
MFVFDDHLALGYGRLSKSAVEIVDRRGRNFGRTQAGEPIVDCAR